MSFRLFYRLPNGNVQCVEEVQRASVYDAMLAAVEANFSLRQIPLPPYWYLNLSLEDLIETAIALPPVEGHSRVLAVYDIWNEKIHLRPRMHESLIKLTTRAAAEEKVEKNLSFNSFLCPVFGNC